jgi:hypothetical protein
MVAINQAIISSLSKKSVQKDCHIHRQFKCLTINLSGHSKNQRAMSLKYKLILVWVPSLIGIKGNERAHKCAEQASLNGSTCDISIREVDSLINRKIIEKRNALWSEYCSTNNIKIKSSIMQPVNAIPSYYRHLDKIYICLKLTKTLLKGHSFTNNNSLNECNQPQTKAHMFFQCKRHIIPRKELEASIQKLGITVIDITTL